MKKRLTPKIEKLLLFLVAAFILQPEKRVQSLIVASWLTPGQHVSSITGTLCRIIIHLLLNMRQKLSIECNYNTLLPIFTSGCSDIAVEIYCRHYSCFLRDINLLDKLCI